MTPPASRRGPGSHRSPSTASHRPPSASSRRGTAGTGSQSRSGRNPSTGRLATATHPPDAAVEAEGDTASRRRAPERTSHTLGLAIAIGLILLVVVGVSAYPTIVRSIDLRRLDKATGHDAITASDTYLEAVDDNPAAVRGAIQARHGTYEAQLHMAKTCKLFAALMDMAQRDHPALTSAQRAEVLTTAAQLYDPKTDADEHMPDEVKDWAMTGKDRPVAVAAIGLIAAVDRPIGDEDAASTLRDIAASPTTDPVRVGAALDGLAKVTDGSNVLLALDLLRTGACDQVIANSALRQKIIANASVDQLVDLVGLLDRPQVAVRTLALDALGGSSMHLTESADAAVRRRDLGQQLATKLTPGTDPAEIAGALHAVHNLRLFGAADAVLTLVSDPVIHKVPGIDAAFLSDTLGHSFIFLKPAMAKEASDRLIIKLTAALDQTATRDIAASALAEITDPFLSLRPALDSLADHGQDSTCFTALIALTKQAYHRPDVVKANGNDLELWKQFLTKDRPRSTEFREMRQWYEKNQQYQRISDGRALLTKNKDYIAQKVMELQAWLAEPNFVPPLGVTRDEVDQLYSDINTLGESVRKAWSGTL